MMDLVQSFILFCRGGFFEKICLIPVKASSPQLRFECVTLAASLPDLTKSANAEKQELGGKWVDLHNLVF